MLFGAGLFAVGCSGDADVAHFQDHGGEGALGGTKGGRGGSGQGGGSGSDVVSPGGSGLGGEGNAACNLADLESCAAGDEICCPGPSGGECVPSSLQNCGGCHVRCSPTAADACLDRACVCGGEPACSGDTPFCHEGRCGECRSDADCDDSPAGEKCVAGACAGCGTHSDCDDPEKPLCDSETRICVPCDHADIELSDDECTEANGDLPAVCVTSGEKAGQCGACDPGTHVGCTEGAPFCSTELECRECLDDDDCPSGKICSPDNACADCAGDADCLGNPAGPECVSGTCRTCDPAGNSGCSGEKDTCHPGLFVCVECMTGAHCPPGEGCVNFACTECGADVDCVGNAKGTHCVPVTPETFECRACDPAGAAGCPPSTVCSAGAGYVCVVD